MAKYKAKLFFLLTVVLFALATLVLTLFNYNPFSADISVFIMFYSSFFVSFSGFLTLFLLFLKSRASSQTSFEFFWPTLRLSIFISLITTILLFLQGTRILDFWVGIPLALAILLLELFFRQSKYKKN